MIKARSIQFAGVTSAGKRKVDVFLVADTNTEVLAIGTNGTTVVGLEAGDEIQFGSMCLTASGHFGILDSSGAWKF